MSVTGECIVGSVYFKWELNHQLFAFLVAREIKSGCYSSLTEVGLCLKHEPNVIAP